MKCVFHMFVDSEHNRVQNNTNYIMYYDMQRPTEIWQIKIFNLLKENLSTNTFKLKCQEITCIYLRIQKGK
jgi:hypothetical protein